MRIMCLNGWGGNLHDPLLAYLRETTPDVLCLQEVVHTPATDKPWLTYRDGDHVLAQRARFFDDVAAALPDHWAMFCPAAMGSLWDGETEVPSFWGLASFVHRSLPVIGQIQGFVHKTYGPDGYGSHPRSRSAHGVRVFDAQLQSEISILHMHGLRDLRGKMDTPERTAQAHRLVEMADALSPGPAPLVVGGDFNVMPESVTFDILRARGLHDLVTGRGFTDTRTARYTKPVRFADYMCVNAAVEVRHFDVVAAPEVSDHRPLVLEI